MQIRVNEGESKDLPFSRIPTNKHGKKHEIRKSPSVN